MIAAYCIQTDKTLHQAMEKIDHNMKGIVIVLADDGTIVATITDGDLRRAILHSIPLETTIAHWLQTLVGRRQKPRTAAVTSSKSELLHIMTTENLRHIPLHDDNNCFVSLVCLDELVVEQQPTLQAVIMAGGFGKRLYPLTKETTKPMLPLGKKPVLEWIIEHLKEQGIRDFAITTHYKPEQIVNYFNDGSQFGVQINYQNEQHPLGTAGALALTKRDNKPLLVINGDILTKVNIRAMHDFHAEHKALMTVAVKNFQYQIPYGVTETDGIVIKRIVEKPFISKFVNAGIYLLQPEILHYIPCGQYFDMTDLINVLLEDNKSVISFPIKEYWLDIGKPDDYQQAERDLPELT